MVVDTPHWSDPELDENGRWYSAPMFDMDSCAFRRVGKNMETASVFYHFSMRSMWTIPRRLIWRSSRSSSGLVESVRSLLTYMKRRLRPCFS
mmetsp:Transcript_22180/g.34002  ORF Transcript_22180/g.34002 Transcript_22180/m.34002 type:complete len:92 (+) Transcript_22180:923-1198(+)